MLGAGYRMFAYNNSGLTLTSVGIVPRRWKIDPSTGLTQEASGTSAIYTNASLATATYDTANGAFQDNTTNKYVGGEFQIKVTVPSGAITGQLVIYLQRTVDGGATWPGNGYGEAVASYTFPSSTAASYVDVIEID